MQLRGKELSRNGPNGRTAIERPNGSSMAKQDELTGGQNPCQAIVCKTSQSREILTFGRIWRHGAPARTDSIYMGANGSHPRAATRAPGGLEPPRTPTLIHIDHLRRRRPTERPTALASPTR